jgi:hypothetical protein
MVYRELISCETKARVFAAPQIVMQFSEPVVVMGVFARGNPSYTEALQTLSVAFLATAAP